MTAAFSSCKIYRYRLDRMVDMFGGPPVAFCLHNPSTADAFKDDATLRRGLSFARQWGASRLVFLNSWAAIATKPADLWGMSDPVGPENDRFIQDAVEEVVRSGGFVVAAWGAVKPPARIKAAAHARIAAVEQLLRRHGCQLKSLGLNRDGSPKHPLYVKNLTKPMSW